MITLKQRKFVEKYVETGNGTQAALDVYNTKDPNVAHSIAVGNLRSPMVRAEIEEALEATGLDLVSISNLLKKATTSGLGQKATNADSLRGIDIMLKLQNAYPNNVQKSAHLRVDFREERRRRLESMSIPELTEDLNRKQKEIQEILEDSTTPPTPNPISEKS